MGIQTENLHCWGYYMNGGAVFWPKASNLRLKMKILKVTCYSFNDNLSEVGLYLIIDDLIGQFDYF